MADSNIAGTVARSLGRSGFRVPASVRAVLNDDGGVLLDVKRGLCFSVNVIGAKVWAQLSDGCDFEGLSSYVARLYGVSHSQAATDVAQFLANLQANGLIEET
jgi:hypothetical protein